MARLVLAILILGAAAGGISVLVLGLRATLRESNEAGPGGGMTVQKLAFVALMLLILGVSVGWLGGL